jgi:hypothetical protein
MIQSIAFTLIFGKPVIMYGGIFTLFLLLTTATIGYLNHHGRPIIPFKWHPRMAALTITVAIVHALFGLSVYFNF